MARRGLVAALVVGVALVAPATHADAVDYSTATGTVLTGYQDMVFDPAHDRLFISQGSDVVVTDAAGRLIRELKGISGSSGLALDVHADRLYVARPDAHEVALVDTGTLAVSDVPVGQQCPQSMALVGSVLWFASACLDSSGEDWTVDALDLSTDVVTAGVLPRQLSWPVVDAAPQAPATLLVMEQGNTSGWFGVYDATRTENGPALRPRAEQTFADNVIVDDAFAPDGQRIVLGGWSGINQSYAVDDLAPMGPRYEHNPRVFSAPIAFRDDGEVAINLESYRPGEYAPQNELQFLGSPAGYAWGRRLLYAVTEQDATEPDERWELEVIYPRDDTKLAVRSNRPSKITIGQRVRLHIHLETTSTRRRVSVFADAPDGTSDLVARPVVPAGGTVVTVAPRRNTHYRVEYAGDHTASPATEGVHLKVRGKVESRIASPGLLHRKGITYARSGRTVWVEASAATYPGGCVTFSLQVRYVSQWWPTKARNRCVPLGSDGRATVRLGFRAKAGEKPYVHRVVTYTKETRDNYWSADPAPEQLIQFCPHGGFCKPPDPVFDGISPVPGPVVSFVRP